MHQSNSEDALKNSSRRSASGAWKRSRPAASRGRAMRERRSPSATPVPTPSSARLWSCPRRRTRSRSWVATRQTGKRDAPPAHSDDRGVGRVDEMSIGDAKGEVIRPGTAVTDPYSITSGSALVLHARCERIHRLRLIVAITSRSASGMKGGRSADSRRQRPCRWPLPRSRRSPSTSRSTSRRGNGIPTIRRGPKEDEIAMGALPSSATSRFTRSLPSGHTRALLADRSDPSANGRRSVREVAGSKP